VTYKSHPLIVQIWWMLHSAGGKKATEPAGFALSPSRDGRSEAHREAEMREL
jgi:hypothetical protein